MTNRTKSILRYVLRLVITAVLLWLAGRQIDFGEFATSLTRARWTYVLLLWMLALVSVWVLSWRFRLILRTQRFEVATWSIFRVAMITMLYGMVLPGLLTSGVKWMLLRKQTRAGGSLIGAMVYNQASNIASKLLFAAVAIATADPGGPAGLAASGIGAGVLLLSLVLLHPRTGDAAVRTVQWPLRALPGKLRERAMTSLDSLRVYQAVGIRFHLAMLAVLTFTSALGVVIYYLAARAASLELPITALAWQMSAVFLLSRLPISIANLGVREFALVKFVAMYGGDASGALVMSAVLFSSVVLTALIGLTFQFLTPPERSLPDADDQDSSQTV